MTLESIEKLREFIGDYFVNSGQAYLQGLAIAGSIEREIAERYMLLPADADGVPIHVGDVLDPPKGSEEYGRLIFESGYSSINHYECGCPELITLYEIMKKTPGIRAFPRASPSS